MRLDGLEGFQAALAAKPAAVYREMRGATEESLKEFEYTMATTRMRGRPGVQSRNGAGGLRESLKRTVGGSSMNTLVGRVVIGGPAAGYAALQEFGGTVHPTRGGYMSIPIGRSITKGGRIASLGGVAFLTPRNFQGQTFIRRSRSNPANLIVWLREGTKIRPVFVLTRSVTIPPRLGFFATWAQLAAMRNARFQQALARAIASN